MGTPEGGKVAMPLSMAGVMLLGQWVCFSNFSFFIGQ
jgi:hypothetical protein